MTRRAGATATVATELGSRYLQQLCKHWSHRFPVTFDPQQGRVELAAARVGLTAEPGRLRIDLEVDSLDDLPRLKTVLEEHLNRFAHREAPLPFVWGKAG